MTSHDASKRDEGTGGNVDNIKPHLWWVGGRVPIADDIFSAVHAHELRPGGGLRCRCGEVHEASGSGWFIVHADERETTARVVVTDLAVSSSIDVSTEEQGRLRSQHRLVHGLVDERAWAAFAQQIMPRSEGTVIRSSPNELVDLLLSAPAFDLEVRQYNTVSEAIADAPLWATKYDKRMAAQLSMRVPRSTLLKQVSGIAIPFQKVCDNLLFQVSIDNHSKASVSLLISCAMETRVPRL